MISITPVDHDRYALELDRNALLVLHNAVNEVCNGIESWEFSTRVGGPRELAEELRESFGAAVDARRTD